MGILKDPTIHYRDFTPPVANENVYIVKHGNRAYLLYAKFTGSVVETHIAAPLRSRRRYMLESGFKWFRQKGAKIAVTAAPPGRTALCRMLESVGFRRHVEKGDDIIFVKVLL